MATILFPSPIFGPIISRRLGVSLGINLLPPDGKLCNFDCIYCECGFNEDTRTRTKQPSREDVRTKLEATLQQMAVEGPKLDVITFAGNGEPTMHPDFPNIVDDVIALRNRYFPEAQISVLSNATFNHRPDIHEALKRVDNNILKLDTVDNDYIAAVDRPVLRYDVAEIVDRVCRFEGKVQIQTLFMKGTYRGFDCDNTSERYLQPWLEALQRIRPEKVYIYTVDRETPAQGLQKAEPEVLDAIAERVRALGITCTASY